MNVRRTVSPLAAAALLALSAAPALGQSFDLSWYTIDAGGATFSTGSSFELGGTAGQPDAGVMSGGQFTLVGGFWAVAGGAPTCDPCDMNCDGAVNAADIAPFLGLLFDGDPPCASCTGDTNGDGLINAGDIQGFLDCLFG